MGPFACLNSEVIKSFTQCDTDYVVRSAALFDLVRMNRTAYGYYSIRDDYQIHIANEYFCLYLAPNDAGRGSIRECSPFHSSE